MKRIISLILVVLMLSAMSALTFANDLEGSYEIIGKASKTEVSAGDTFTYSITFAETNADSFEMACTDATWSFSLNYDSNAFELVGAPTIGYGLKLDDTYSISSEGDYYAYMMSNGLTSVTFTKDTYILVFTFTAKEASSASEFSISNMDMADADSFNSFELGSNLTAKLDTVSFKGGEPEEEEIFTDMAPADLKENITAGEKIGNITLESGAVQIAVFGKAPSTGLEKGTYGIMFGELKFPGIVDVNADQYWCIKLVSKDGKNKSGTSISTGELTYNVYIENDDKTITKSADRTVKATVAQ